MKHIVIGMLCGLLLMAATAATALEGADGRDAAASVIQRAVDLYDARQLQQSRALLNNFIVDHYTSPQIGRAYLYLARILLESNDGEQALRYLRQIPAAERNATTRLLEGRALFVDGAPAEAAATLLPIDPAQLTVADRQERLQTLAAVRAEQKRVQEALFFLDRALRQPQPLRRDEVLNSVAGLLTRLERSELTEAAFLYQGSAIGQGARWRLAEMDVAEGRDDAALARLNAIIDDPTPFPQRPAAVALWERLSGRTWQRHTIGAVLPLTGRFAPFGSQVRRGMELALELHNAQNQPIDIIFRDSSGDAPRAAEAVAQLANEERVLAILGPLTGQSAVSAARLAQQEQTPLLALSQRDGLPELGDYVFRNSLTSRQQARALARYATEQGMTSFGVLAPDNRLGHEMERLFAEEVLALNGMVTAVEFYATDATNFDREIKRLMGVDPDFDEEDLTEEEREARLLTDLFYPDHSPVDFDALFIPDYAARIGLVAPQVVYYGIEGIPLLGINGWNSPDLTRLAGQFVEGAVFVDSFFRYSPYPFVQEFVERFYEHYGDEPQILEAQGYDAAAMVLSLLARPDITTRDDLRLALARLRNYPGVTGATSFTLEGDVEKVLFLLQVQNGNIVQIN